MLMNVFSYVFDALNYQGIVVVAWVGVALGHVVYLQRGKIKLSDVEFRPGRAPAFNPGGIAAWLIASVVGVVLKVVDTTESQFFELWGLPLTFVLSTGIYGALLAAANRGWFELVRPYDPIDEVDDAWNARARCHACERSYVVREMDRDPVVGHEAICASCATGTAFYAAGRREATT